MKALTILSFLVLFFLNTTSTMANGQTNFLSCQKIESNIDRLQCFDDITNKNKPLEIDSKHSIENEVKAIVEQPLQIPKVPLNLKQESRQTKNNQTPSDFGLEQANQDDIVESFIVGEFKGWKKGLRLKLKNGQVWKVTSARSNYSKKQDPAITISRGFMGSFNAKIKDMKTTAKVRRVK